MANNRQAYEAIFLTSDCVGITWVCEGDMSAALGCILICHRAVLGLAYHAL